MAGLAPSTKQAELPLPKLNSACLTFVIGVTWFNTLARLWVVPVVSQTSLFFATPSQVIKQYSWGSISTMSPSFNGVVKVTIA